ncbi:HNH endonuclease [Natronococcus sp. A-GB1]|uniref:HNH endonuclease n=1 Tax=Natronococcus sp. A-GB1 TaxID=3037648 RepID=UPI00241CE8C0|nr:HNH endonuclease [Natronococcus sp. A-GB1]MDG5760244.1 HNH endonuclease [Natronococcus sp. A-GB1]
MSEQPDDDLEELGIDISIRGPDGEDLEYDGVSADEELESGVAPAGADEECSLEAVSKQSTRDYPDDWDRRRQEVYRRDDYQCANCRRRGGPHGDVELHAHHIVPKSRGGIHELSNLITVCEACHTAVHNRDAVAPTAIPPEERGKTAGGELAEAVDEIKSARRQYRSWKRLFNKFF